MAGSLRNFQYTTDSGDVFLFRGDESNVEAVNGTSANIAAGNVDAFGIPRNIRMRTCTYVGLDGNRSVTVVATTQAIYLNPPATIADTLPNNDGDLVLARKNPERIRLYPNVDTGLTDGDSPL